jgi:hypothetical protein
MSEHGSQFRNPAGGDDPGLFDAHRVPGHEDTSGAIEMGPVPFEVTPARDDAQGHQPRSRSRTRRIALSALLAAGLAGAAVLGTTGWRITAQKDATLTVPQNVAGLRLNNTADAATTAEYLRTALTAEVTLDDAVGGVYTDPADEGRSVLFFGGTGLIWTPERDLETAFDLVEDDAGAVTGLRGVPAGRLGGAMKCGTADDSSGAITVCGWADHGSLALALFPNRSVAEAGPLLRAIREAAQTRN